MVCHDEIQSFVVMGCVILECHCWMIYSNTVPNDGVLFVEPEKSVSQLSIAVYN